MGAGLCVCVVWWWCVCVGGGLPLLPPELAHIRSHSCRPPSLPTHAHALTLTYPVPPPPASHAALLQVEAIYDRLRNIGEYIGDTEEYINIELDAGRNRLIRLDIILTAASFSIAPCNMLAGARPLAAAVPRGGVGRE